MTIAQPDVTLILDLDGVIREATLSHSLSDERVNSWLGRPWNETITDAGGDKVRRMIDDARQQGVSAFRQVTQRFPSGLELPIEYTTVLLGGRAGLLVIGKSLQAVAELQARLIAAQQAMERDYWKLREVETRYRLLFDTSQEPVVLLKAADLRIMQANPAALAALELTGSKGQPTRERNFLIDVCAQDRDAFQAMAARVREQGKSPGILVHLGKQQKPWLLRASLMSPEPDSIMMLQLSPGGPGQTIAVIEQDTIAIDDMIERLPDAFVVIDCGGVIRRANRSFLDLVEAGAKGSVVGEKLTRWLWRPGADLSVLLANVERHRFVRMFTTTVQGELGTTTEVEISAAGNADNNPQFIGVLIRDVGRRMAPSGDESNLRASLNAMVERIGKTPLRSLVRDTVGVVERHYVRSALELAHDNRTVAAELLGLSRQSLYAKLSRYGLDGGSEPSGQG